MVVKKHQPQPKAPHLVIEALAGCLAGDTILNLNRAGKGFQMKIADVVKRANRNQEGLSGRAWDMNIPTYVARAEGEVIRLGKLKEAWCSGMKPTYLLSTDAGRTIRATAKHPFLNKDGDWVQMQDIRAGDVLQVNIGRSTKGRNKEKIQYSQVLTRFHPNQINNGENFKVPKHRAIVEANMNGMTLREFLWVVRYSRVRSSKLAYLQVDQLVHHKNGNSKDNTLSNLEVVTGQTEHSEKHEWGNNVLWQVGFDVVSEIQPNNMEITYDIEVEDDPHNFIANGFVVHNTGKTFSMIQGLNLLKGKNGVNGSPQQEAIWEALCAEKPQGNVAFVAFNKSIATELQSKVPVGVLASTLHSMGLKAITNHFGRVKVDDWKIFNLCDEHFSGRDKNKFVNGAIKSIVGLLKMNLLEPTIENMEMICARYSVECNGDRPLIFDVTPMIFQQSIDLTEIIDFNDMVYFPFAHKLNMEFYELLCVDEGQDLNRCQQHLVLSVGQRVCMVGDPNQAIYGFAGADCESIPRMVSTLTESDRGCTVLPLTVTRRCPKSVVSLAQSFVPSFEAMPDASLGEIRSIAPDQFAAEVRERDMVLSRVNAPLISSAFGLLKIGKRVKIQGRDIGKGLTTLINKLKADSVPDLQAKLDVYRQTETSRLLKKRNNEMALVNLEDKISCIECFMQGKTQVSEVIKSIEAMFSDEEKVGSFVLFSSIHRAKGLEADRVFILNPGLMPHPMAKQPDDKAQEVNLQYVATTRSKRELVFVGECKWAKGHITTNSISIL